jgi:phosphatidate cytidylyltransferase
MLSPKKTWEGFIGGFICTAVFSFYASWWMSQSTWLTCPRKDLSLGPLHCTPSPIFQSRTFTIHGLAAELPGPLEEILALLHALLPGHVWDMMQTWSIAAMPVQLHAMSMSCFASFISPFGEPVWA